VGSVQICIAYTLHHLEAHVQAAYTHIKYNADHNLAHNAKAC
jgi:hypothetical protein